jgi:uncharacterized protein
MLSALINLFGRSPFAPLQSHMEKVAQCVHLLKELFIAIEAKDYSAVDKIAERISTTEHEADLMKNDIRNHLPKTLYLPIDRSHLLEILTQQDKIADKAEDIAVLVTLKQIDLPDSFKANFYEFMDKNLECFEAARSIIKEMHELLESSFGGIEAEKVRSMVDDVALKEHEADIVQRKLLKAIFNSEDEMPYSTFYLWQKIFQALAAISNISENLANRIRMTLELK